MEGFYRLGGEGVAQRRDRKSWTNGIDPQKNKLQHVTCM